MKINYKDLIGVGFEEFYNPEYKAHFFIDPAGKDCKKSATYNGFFALFHLLQNPMHNVVIARKEAKMHKENSLKDFKFALKKFSDVTGHDWSKSFHIVHSPIPKVVFLPTGQEINYIPFNLLDANRSAVKTEVGLNTLLIIDEAIERNDGDQGDQELKDWKSAFSQLWDTIFRGDYKAIGIDFNSVCRTVISYNPWTGVNWVDDMFIGNKIQEDIEQLERYGKQVFYSPKFQFIGGVGKVVTFKNVLINEFIEEDKKIGKFMKKFRDVVTYLTETLGKRGQLTGGIYAHLIKLIKQIRRKDAPTDLFKYVGGMDYGNVNDACTCVVTGFTRLQTDKWMEMCIMGAEEHCNADSTIQLNDFQQAEKMIDFIEKLVVEFPDIKESRLLIKVDAHAISFRDILRKIALERGLTWLTFQQSSKPRIQQRIQAERQLISQGRVSVLTDMKGKTGMRKLLRELSRSKYNSSGARADKDDHLINAWEYSFIDDIVMG